MATKLPRLNVTVTEAQHRLLAELGALEGRSSASYLREMLDAAMPMLEAILPLYEAIKRQEAMRPQALQSAIRDALAGVEAGRAQMDLLALIAEQKPALANDDSTAPGDAAARSGATEDGAARSAPAKRNRRAR